MKYILGMPSQNSINFLKIYCCMGLTWMCLEVLTEIYDLVKIIRGTSKLVW